MVFMFAEIKEASFGHAPRHERRHGTGQTDTRAFCDACVSFSSGTKHAGITGLPIDEDDALLRS